ncbi:hypothetical protein [Akkermansia sp.]|uniref:hypothetical protein n=1 Tax=Akkermansia sp. TaxID=1872421 RepID=UPI0025BC1473|nr:hypothetical protein [Akkermansia sp.]
MVSSIFPSSYGSFFLWRSIHAEMREVAPPQMRLFKEKADESCRIFLFAVPELPEE